MPTELLKVATLVGTPLALLSLVVIVIGYVYIRKLGSNERTLSLCPESDRSRIADSYLTRYGIDSSAMTAAQKVELVKTEMSLRNRYAILLLLIAASIFTISLIISTLAYALSMHFDAQRIRENAENDSKLSIANNEMDIVKKSMQSLAIELKSRKSLSLLLLNDHKRKLEQVGTPNSKGGDKSIARKSKTEENNTDRIVIANESDIIFIKDFIAELEQLYNNAIIAAECHNSTLVHYHLNQIYKAILAASNHSATVDFAMSTIVRDSERNRTIVLPRIVFPSIVVPPIAFPSIIIPPTERQLEMALPAPITNLSLTIDDYPKKLKDIFRRPLNNVDASSLPAEITAFGFFDSNTSEKK